MKSWHRRYNVSGTVHCGVRIEDWCQVLRTVLQTDFAGAIGHYTGAISVYAFSSVADVVSGGFEVHEVWVLVNGDRPNWLGFAASMESALAAVDLPCSLVVHEAEMVLK